MTELPRYWPILYILSKVKCLHDNFFLQKYIYLAKVEGKVPIRYTFTKEDYGPYTIGIKHDFLYLSSIGLIDATFDYRWTFKLREAGKEWIRENYRHIPPTWRNAIDKVLKDFRNMSMFGLANYIYKNHIRSLEQDRQLKEEVMDDCTRLLEKCSEFPPSHNSLLLRGSLDYLLAALDGDASLDSVQRDQLLQFARGYLENVGETLEIINGNQNLVADLDLKDLEEDFGVIEDMCAELGIMDRLDPRSLLNIPL